MSTEATVLDWDDMIEDVVLVNESSLWQRLARLLFGSAREDEVVDENLLCAVEEGFVAVFEAAVLELMGR